MSAEKRRSRGRAGRGLSSRLEAILAAIPEIIMEVDNNKVYTWANPAGIEFFGEDVVGKEAGAYFEGKQETYKTVEPIFAGAEDVVYLESWQRRRDGQKRLLAWRCRTLKDPANKVIGALSTATDITELRRIEEAIRSDEARLSLIYNNVSDVVFVLDVEPKDRYRFVSVNKRFLEVTGLREDQILGRLADQVIPEPAHALVFGNYREAVRTGRPVHWEEISTYPTGTKVGEVTVAPIYSEAGACTQLIGTVHDITERNRAELALSASEAQLSNALQMARVTLGSLRSALGGIIQVLSTATEKRDPYTAGHQKRVADLAEAVGQRMGLPVERVEGLRLAGTIHDIGKVAVPSEILSKPSRLTETEFKLIQIHPQVGYDIVKDVDFSWPIAEMILQHHERLDGSGYPKGLKGEEILLEARILGVADVVEAMASYRPYRPALGIEAAVAEVEKNKGVLYDPDVAAACFALIKDKKFTFQ